MIITEHIVSLVKLALQEDIGRGDCTSAALIDESLQACADILVKQPCCVAGLPVITKVFEELDPRVQVVPVVTDGYYAEDRTVVCRLIGPARSILTGERTALNFLARLTGVATLTQEAVTYLSGTKTKLLDTRKTTPGFRALEKYAVRVGGGHNHRFGLDDMVLIKDNHVHLAGGIGPAIERAKNYTALSRKIEVEVDTLEQLQEALKYDIDMVLLDNMDNAMLSRAVELTGGRVPLEASGNMTITRLAEVAKTGVDFISMGGLTHSAVSVDVGLDVKFEPEG